jgi:hypothetical protein
MFENRIITPAGGALPSPTYYSSPAFNEAVNASRFLKGFGITALIYALVSTLGLTLLGGGIGVGVGLFILQYDKARYYKILGAVVILFALLGTLIPALGAAILAGAIVWKGVQVLSVLSKEGRGDDEWVPSRKRAIVGTVTGGIALLISVAVILLFFLALVIVALGQRMA